MAHFQAHYYRFMNNLTPEKRLDKNGVLTTKHVRAVGKPVAVRRQTPAPTLGEAGKKKKVKLRPKQVEQRYRNFHFHPVVDGDKRLLDGRPVQDPIFTASDAEIFDVLSVTDSANAILLLEKDIRSADEARAYLREMDAGDLIRDYSGLMNEMLARNVSPEDTSDAILRLDLHLARRPNQSDYSENYPDTIEFLSASAFENMRGRTNFMKDILEGRISFGDIKAIGTTRLKPFDRLYFLRDILARKQSGERDFDTDDMKRFLDKSSTSGLVQGHFKSVIHLFDELGMEGVDKLDDLKSFSSYFWEEMKNDDEDTRFLVERSLYFAQLSEALQNGPERSGRYWGKEFQQDASLLRNSGIEIEDATRLMGEGMTAQQVVGVVNGIEAAVSDGWL
jgi:hypothetical protein